MAPRGTRGGSKLENTQQETTGDVALEANGEVPRGDPDGSVFSLYKQKKNRESHFLLAYLAVSQFWARLNGLPT